jgi:rod shape determining protein RodA
MIIERNIVALLRRMDWLMLGAILCLAAFGISFIYSACYLSDDLPVRTLYKKQAIWAIAGLCSYFLCVMVDYRTLADKIWLLYGAAVLLLVLTLLIGTHIWGARRWLNFFGIGIQPSEVAKLAVILCLAQYLSLPGPTVKSSRALWVVMMIIGLPMMLIIVQPDLSTALIFIPMAFCCMYVAGVSSRALTGLVLAGLLLVTVVFSLVMLPKMLGASEELQASILKYTPIQEYHLRRIEGWFNPEFDPTGVNWSTIQSKMAVGSGGLMGKGYLGGLANFLGFLPRNVAPTDFIFSVIGEETGFFGAMVVLTLFLTVLLCGLRTALRAQDRMGQLICVGVVVIMFCHVFVNIAMTVGLLPITGLPLPLLSYGGSFMISTMVALGLVQSVHVRNQPQKEFQDDFR